MGKARHRHMSTEFEKQMEDDHMASITAEHNNMEVTLDIIKSLANLGTNENDEIDQVNLFFAIKKLCEVGHL